MILGTPEAIDGIVRKTCWDNLDLVPASLSLQRVDLLIAREPAAATQQLGSPAAAAPGPGSAGRPLRRHRGGYAAGTGMLSLNAIAAANLLIIPIEPHMYSLGSSVQYFRILRDVIRRHRTASACSASTCC